MHTQFVGSQSVHIAVPEQPVPIQHYLRQPQRLVHALVDTTRMEQLSEELFRLKMRPLSFMSLSIQPIVDMKVWADADGTVHLRSVGCQIRGIEYINDRFALNLKGELVPYQSNGKAFLKGIANLEVQVELPLPFSLTPKPILETAGNGLLKSVLLTVKQRLMHHLISDYCRWAMQDIQAGASSQSGVLSAADTPTA